ncbi:GT2D2 protein, partial [Polyodon spathula]|nr:GT2D2 protein [Polyodon spathula]
MSGEKNGLVALVCKKLQKVNCPTSLVTYHCILHLQALCGKVLKMDNIMVMVVKIIHFIRAKIAQLSDAKWLCDFAFLFDITEQLKNLNVKLQGCKQVIIEMCNGVKALQLKLHGWEKYMQQGNLSHFLMCQSVRSSFFQIIWRRCGNCTRRHPDRIY